MEIRKGKERVEGGWMDGWMDDEVFVKKKKGLRGGV